MASLLPAIILAIYAIQVEPYWLEVTHTHVPFRGLPSGLDGITIVQLGDLHLGLGPGDKLLASALDKASAEKPDLIVLTGDFRDRQAGTEREAYSSRLTQPLAGLYGRYGVYAVLGNHDCGDAANLIGNSLRDARVVVLRDERVRLEVQGNSLWLVGIEDVGTEPGANWSDFERQHRGKEDVLQQILLGILPRRSVYC